MLDPIHATEAIMSDGRSLGDVVTARSSVAKQTTQITDRKLLATISAGSRSAMAELYFLYFARLANFFVHMTGRVDLVEELISDTMFDVWRESPRIGSDASVSAWITGLAYAHGQMRLAGTRSDRPHVPTSAPYTQHGSALTTTSAIPSDQQGFLMKLPFEERAVLHLVYADDFSRQSIADIMNTSCKRVDMLLARARRRLWHLKEEIKQQQPCSLET
jgi:DNA-directed RNA polymerase specialized sigma24 family protein